MVNIGDRVADSYHGILLKYGTVIAKHDKDRYSVRWDASGHVAYSRLPFTSIAHISSLATIQEAAR